MKKLAVFAILTIIVFVLQVAVVGGRGIGWGRPDFLLILVVLWGWERGWKEGLPVGFTVGLINDIFFSPLLGLNAFSLSLVGYLSGEIRERVYEENVVLLLMAAGACSFLDGFTLSLLSFLFHFSSPVFGKLTYLTLVSALYNCGLVFLIFVVREFWEGRLY
jgi:rod shape-determining protein MreD